MADLKSMLLGSKNFKIKRVQVEVWDPDTGRLEKREVGVKQPTLFERACISRDSTKAISAEDKAKVNAQVVVYAACNPDTGAPLFESANLAELTKQAGGGWVDQVAMAALEVMALPVTESFCTLPALDAEGRPVLEDGKPAKCGGKLVPTEKYCPRCGHEAPPVLEQVQRS